MSADPENHDPILDAALWALREHGPLTSEAWADLLVAGGHGTAEEMVGYVEMIDELSVGLLSDGRSVALDTLLEGRVFTHRLTAPEVRTGLIDAEPDLAPVLLLAMVDEELPRALFADYDADEIAELGVSDDEFPDGSALLFDPADLDGCEAGDVVAVEVRDGAITVRRVDGDLAAADVTAALNRLIGDDNADNLETVVWQLLADDPALCTTPTRPLGDLVDDAGYVCEGDYVAARGFDFDAHHLARHVALVAREADLHPDEVDAVLAFVQLVAAVHDDELDLDAARELLEGEADRLAGLEDPAAAAAALDVSYGHEDEQLPALYTVAEALAGYGPRRVRASGHWLAGMAADSLGDVAIAERHFEDAVGLDEEWTPALFELAQIASDRGDAQRGLDLLNRIEGGDSERLHAVLTRFAPAEHPELGRNDKCWCGSGRKYKVCHLGKSDSTLDERAHWLYEKARLFVQSTSLFDQVLLLAELRATHRGDVESEDADALALDTVLFEGGMFEHFLSRRGRLLPDDEVELAARWLLVSRSVHEVVAVNGESATLRDVRTGDDADVVVPDGVTVGDLFAARVVLTGSTVQIIGGAEPVPADRRDDVLAALAADPVDPIALVESLSAD
ncbi:SEC-C metal-binding domain-containing protein [Rhodococcus gannanensis]|uniref:SEC-C metal-binding domain-containing protein n=1 Tax=Rhodococcus gannanensis TaxID=1960308 RepID=A0ABW4NZS2_9NOCA